MVLLTVQVLSKAVHLDGCRLRHASWGGTPETTALPVSCCIWTFFFLSFRDTHKPKCKQGRQLSPTVLLYERREVALVFHALEDVNRTSGLCSGCTFLNSGYIN